MKSPGRRVGSPRSCPAFTASGLLSAGVCGKRMFAGSVLTCIHTVLSPVPSWIWVPSTLCKGQGIRLDIIAVSDHNAAENVAAVMELRKVTGRAIPH